MKKNSILIALALFSAGGTWAEELPKDTLKVIDVEEIVVIAAPKEPDGTCPEYLHPRLWLETDFRHLHPWDRFTHQYTVSRFVRRQCPLHRQISFRLQLCRH